MSNFIEIWNKEVRPLAMNCVEDNNFIHLLSLPDHELSIGEKEYLRKSMEKYKDPYSLYYISIMIKIIDRSLMQNNQSFAEFMAKSVYDILNEPNYLQTVFNGDTSNEECKSKTALREGLQKLLNLNK